MNQKSQRCLSQRRQETTIMLVQRLEILETSQLLFSCPQPLINGGENTWMSGGSWSEARPCLGVGMGAMHGNVGGWSEARPWVQQGGYQWSNPEQGFSTGITSSYPQQPMLYSSPQTCCGWSPPVCHTLPSPFPPDTSPAYCSSCLVFGKVFTVSLV